MLDDIGAYAEGVSSLGRSAAMPLLLLALSWAFSAIHVFEEWKGSDFPLWRAFGAIEGVYVPNSLGFLFFTVALLLILWIIGLGAIVGLGFGGQLTAQQGVFWLGALIGALVSDCLFSHWIPYLAGYRPNPGVRSTALYVVEAAARRSSGRRTVFPGGVGISRRLAAMRSRLAPVAMGQRTTHTVLGDNQSFAARPWFSLESESLLRGFRRSNANALQFEHAGLRFRAARRGETADFAARGQHSVTGNDQRRGIFSHRLADIARRFAAGADLLRQCAIGGRAPPADPAQGVINPRKEQVLAREVELNLREVRFLAGEIPRRRLDDRCNAFGRRSRLRANGAAAHQSVGRFGRFRR